MQKAAPKYITNKLISMLHQYIQCRKLNKWNPVIMTVVYATLHSIRYSSVSSNSSLLSTTLFSLVRTKLIYIKTDSSHDIVTELDSTYNRILL